MASKTLIILLTCIVFLSACTSAKPEITSTVSSARDIDGDWVGSVTFTERSPNCVYRGDFELALQQNGNNVQGGFTVTVKSIEKQGPNCLRTGTSLRYGVGGTVSSSSISLLISNTDKLKGSFTTDQLTLRWEQCDACSSGPAIKFTGPMFLARKRS